MNNLDYKKIARITGVLYLLIIICAGFSQGVVREGLIVSGNAGLTASQILENSTLFTWGITTDLIAFMLDIVVSVLLYFLLRPVSQVLAIISSAFRLIAHPAIGSLNLLNHYAALHILESESLIALFSPAQLQEISLMFMDFHNMGYLIAGALFGIHCILLGLLMYRSNLFPKLLGMLLFIAGIGYLIESFGFLYYPNLEVVFAMIVGVTAVLGEVSLMVWLLVKGVKPIVSDTVPELSD